MPESLPGFYLGLGAGILIGIAASLLPPFYGDAPYCGSEAGPSGGALPAAAPLATPAASVQPIPAVPRSFSLLAVGDVLLTRHIGENLQNRGWGYLFTGLSPLIQSADIAFCNLECPASVLGTPYPGKPEIVTFRADPMSLLGLKKAGFDIVSLANNHMNDYGAPALKETIEALDVLGIRHAGGGLNEAEAHAPARIMVNGIRISLLAYAEPIWSTVPAGSGPGVAMLDPERVKADIAREKAESDLIIISIHWGEEHQGRPRASDRELAHEFIDAGAGAILGHHPHVLQGIEIYKGAPVFYSLGNCVFDMAADTTYQSTAVTITFGAGKCTGIRMIPVQINRKSLIPTPATGDEQKAISALLVERSAFLGTTLATAGDGSLELRP